MDSEDALQEALHDAYVRAVPMTTRYYGRKAFGDLFAQNRLHMSAYDD